MGDNKIKLTLVDKEGVAVDAPNNPVERVFSFYKYKKSLGHIDGNLNFESYIDECKKQAGSIEKETYDFWALIGGKYAKLLLEPKIIGIPDFTFGLSY